MDFNRRSLLVDRFDRGDFVKHQPDAREFWREIEAEINREFGGEHAAENVEHVTQKPRRSASDIIAKRRRRGVVR